MIACSQTDSSKSTQPVPVRVVTVPDLRDYNSDNSNDSDDSDDSDYEYGECDELSMRFTSNPKDFVDEGISHDLSEMFKGETFRFIGSCLSHDQLYVHAVIELRDSYYYFDSGYLEMYCLGSDWDFAADKIWDKELYGVFEDLARVTYENFELGGVELLVLFSEAVDLRCTVRFC